LEEVKDIRDELNILQSICEDQKDLLQKLSGLIAKPQGAAQQEIEKDPILNYYKERSDIDLRIDKIRKLQTDATTTYDSVSHQKLSVSSVPSDPANPAQLNHLLDLKQKNANISEAVESRKQAVQTRIQAEETTKQGRTIMVFTIVTIIFVSTTRSSLINLLTTLQLPMSFLTSFFALNVDSFPHQDGNLSYPGSWVFSRICASPSRTLPCNSRILINI
jgi:Mg2+ and Co2+ transporter CorA